MKSLLSYITHATYIVSTTKYVSSVVVLYICKNSNVGDERILQRTSMFILPILEKFVEDMFAQSCVQEKLQPG